MRSGIAPHRCILPNPEVEPEGLLPAGKTVQPKIPGGLRPRIPAKGQQMPAARIGQALALKIPAVTAIPTEATQQPDLAQPGRCQRFKGQVPRHQADALRKEPFLSARYHRTGAGRAAVQPGHAQQLQVFLPVGRPDLIQMVLLDLLEKCKQFQKCDARIMFVEIGPIGAESGNHTLGLRGNLLKGLVIQHRNGQHISSPPGRHDRRVIPL